MTGRPTSRRRRPRRVRSAAVGLLSAALLAGSGRPEGVEVPPRLLLVVVVDQMRADYLDRYGDLFVGGLARLRDGGAVFTQARQDHAATVTATGHATIATGVFPSRHGIVGNDFFDRTEGQSVYAAFDPDAPLLGDPGAPGRSPKRLRRSGFADWLKDASPASRVFSVAIKDRSAILMGGRSADGVYWYHAPQPGLVTSAYYASRVPEWVGAFAASDPVARFFRGSWTRLLPDSAYHLSREDDFGPEGQGWPRTFPYVFHELFPEGTPERPGESFRKGFPYTPFADELAFEFARAAVEHEGLGADDAPDFLFVGASAADYIGHRWGPYSQEVEDYYLRLDRELGRFFEFLDERLGEGRWSVVLTSDHGVAPAPEEMARRGEDARRIASRDFGTAVRTAMDDAFEEAGLESRPVVRWVGGPYLLSENLSGKILRNLRETLARRFQRLDFVSDAFTADEVAAADPFGDGTVSAFRRSYDPERSPDVLLHLEPFHIVGGTPATHGSAWDYDMHVPLVFYGPGIPPGTHPRRVRTVDIAPTMAALLGIPAPPDLDGTVLGEVIAAGVAPEP